MVNRSRSQIYHSIVELLKKDSFTTLQIANELKINWETAKNALETLSKINLVSSEERNGKTYYTTTAGFFPLRDDTLLGLPISEEQKNLTSKLLKSIETVWKTLLPSRPLNKTFRQKILVKLIKKANIQNIPYGWYLFGQCAILHSPDLSNIPVTHDYDETIKSIIAEYKDLSTTELLLHHYREENNEVYMNRIKISDILLHKFTEESLASLKRILMQFIFSFGEADEDVNSALNAFHSVCSRLINSKNLNEMEDVRQILSETFNVLWEIMATYNLYTSLRDKVWYDKMTLERYYKLKLESSFQVFKEYYENLQDYCPPIIIHDKYLNELRALRAGESR